MSNEVEKEESFEKKIERLEEIVAKVENEVLPLAKAMSYYQEGIKLIKDCESLLKDAKSKIIVEEK